LSARLCRFRLGRENRMSARIKDALFRLGSGRPSDQGDPRRPDIAVRSQQEVEHKGAHRLRVSSLYRRLLAEFVVPNSANAVARSTFWKDAFHEPVRMVLTRLKTHALLVEPDNPRARMCFNRDESDLRVLCLEYGLLPIGSADQLADRLLTVDSSGWLLGYAGELLQCSEFASRTMLTHNVPPADVPSPEPVDNTVIWDMLKDQADQTARDGDLLHCRNVCLAMANHLLQRKKQSKALQALCAVCVFDLCGVRNRSDASVEIRKAYAGFDATRASLDPWLVKRVSKVSHDMALSVVEVQEIFLHVSARLKLPKDPRSLWAVLQRALEGSLAFDDEIRRNRVIRNLLDY
jgi:hypothetical protein